MSLAADGAIVDRVQGGLVGEGDHEGLVLATDDGMLADLGPIRDVSSVHRVSRGWVVVTADASAARLWWVTDGAEPRVVLSGLDEIVTDGTRVAWRLGSRISTGTLAADGSLDRQADYQAAAGGVRPAGFLGGEILLQRATGGGAVSWALWRPDECAVESCADFDPVWNQGVLRVFGAEPGGQAAIGLVPAVSKDQGVCLARLRIADDLPVLAQVCPRGLPSTGPASLSPDGRWLIATSGGATAVVVVDVAAAFDGDPSAVLPVDTTAKPAAVPVWSGPEEAVYPAEDRLVWVRPDRVRDGAAEAVAEAELAGALPTLVQLSR